MRRFVMAVLSVVVAVTVATFVGHDPAPVSAAAPKAYVPAPLPTGAEGALIAYGKKIVTDTHRYAGAYAVSAMSCEACHIDAGTKPHAGSFVGIYGKFPQWNKRSHRFIALQDRLAECFLYSMNGKPPAYESREMIALTAYIAYLSRGTVVGQPVKGQGLIDVAPPHAPSVAAGKIVYAAQCTACHGADGNGGGNGAFPPLWGPRSFNAGAGMHRQTTMTAFVRYNMPYGSAPNTLTAQQAADVTAYVLSHPRPSFVGTRTVVFPQHDASYY